MSIFLALTGGSMSTLPSLPFPVLLDIEAKSVVHLGDELRHSLRPCVLTRGGRNLWWLYIHMQFSGGTSMRSKST